jgi:hypothetical protein
MVGIPAASLSSIAVSLAFSAFAAASVAVFRIIFHFAHLLSPFLLVCAKNTGKCIDKQNRHSLCFYLMKRNGKNVKEWSQYGKY